MNSKILPLIFVGGIHGVGKTTFSRILAHRLLKKHLSAGAIIASYKNAELTAEKEVHDIKGDQDILISALSDIRKTESIVLDGHFCLLDEHRAFSDLPLSLFEQIRPEIVIILEDSPPAVQKRLTRRDNKCYDLEFINSFQLREVAHGSSICKDLGVPFIVCTSAEIDNVVSIISSL